MLTENRFKASQQDGFRPYDESIVFISYKRDPDLPIAIECAERLENVPGITYWIDHEDECLSDANATKSRPDKAIKTAKCIEKGLDVASALLGIIGPDTFASPWVPYEIGGARGRQRFSITYTSGSSYPHPLIAHFIHNVNIRDIPDFVALGTPLFRFDELFSWAKSVADILKKVNKSWNRKISLEDRKDIHSNHGIDKIYERNIRNLRY